MIDTDNNITAHENNPASHDGLVAFTTEKELTTATAEWPISRLVETWNSFAGTPGFDELKPVKKFENRVIATARIWDAIQVLLPTGLPPANEASIQAPAACAALAALKKAKAGLLSNTPRRERASKTKAAKSPKASKSAGEPKAPREGSKMATVIAMIQRKGGATLEAIQEETGRAKHTIRGFMSTLTRRTGVEFTSTLRESDKARVDEGVR
ncbi:MAG: DUF3489 domain-containing protein [Thermoguttaceae bacterium]